MDFGIHKYLQSLGAFIKLSTQLLILSSAVGVYIATFQAKETQQIIKQAAEALSPGINISGFDLFLFIFENNVMVMFYSLVESLIFGISSILMIVINGITIGVFMVLVTEKTSFLYFIAGILPHGIFELPAAIIASAMGMKIGYSIIQKILRKKVDVVREISNAIKYFILIVIPLLAIAALIETFFTPALLSLFSR